jgi:hypothetical protein
MQGCESLNTIVQTTVGDAVTYIADGKNRPKQNSYRRRGAEGTTG